MTHMEIIVLNKHLPCKYGHIRLFEQNPLVNRYQASDFFIHINCWSILSLSTPNTNIRKYWLVAYMDT